MKSCPPQRFVALAAALLGLLFVAPVCARDDAERRWTSVQSKNFLLVGNANEREIHKVAARLEQFREAFMRLLSVDHFDASVPMTVMVFKTDEDYRPFEPLYRGQPAGVAGFFQSNQDVDYLTLSIDARHVRSPYALAFHEYVHLLVRNSFRNAPLWFNEGLAEYYSTFEISDARRVTLGKPISTRIQTLRERELLPLEMLLRVDAEADYYNEQTKRDLFYSESWALVHYLLSGPRRTQLSTYLDLLAKGAGVEDAFRQAFQADFKVIESELRQYIQLNKYPQQLITFDRRVEFDELMRSSELTESETQFYLGDLLLHTNRLNDADAYLQKAVLLNPKLAAAQASLGVLRMRQNLFEDALQHLRLASEADSSNYLVHYYYAYVLSHEGKGSDDSSSEGYYDDVKVATMRAELKKAIELAPNFAEAYRLLAFINLVRDDHLDEAIALLKKALELSPRRQEFALLLAQVHLRREEFKTAREVLNTLVQTSINPQVRAHAQQLLVSVAAREEYVARIRALDAEAAKEEAPPLGVIQPCDAPQPGPQIKKLRFEGEQACGLLVQVECDDKGVILLVEAGGRTLKLHSDNLNRIRFVTYTADVKGHVTCGLRVPANPVLITYRPAKDAKGQVDGEVIAVEFVPRDWNANH